MKRRADSTTRPRACCRRLGPGSALPLVLLGACTIAPAPGGRPTPADEGELPSGYGTLRQEDVSLSLTSGDLRLMVTPLHPSVTHVTAPDTQRRLDALAAAYAPSGQEVGTGMFLVSFFSDRPDVRFDPEEVQLVVQGFRLRPISITPITPSWGERRVDQRQQVMAVYRFSGEIDLEADIALVYLLDQTSEWTLILPRIQAERARVRARAGPR